jgi:hypothetical protein
MIIEHGADQDAALKTQLVKPHQCQYTSRRLHRLWVRWEAQLSSHKICDMRVSTLAVKLRLRPEQDFEEGGQPRLLVKALAV